MVEERRAESAVVGHGTTISTFFRCSLEQTLHSVCLSVYWVIDLG